MNRTLRNEVCGDFPSLRVEPSRLLAPSLVLLFRGFLRVSAPPCEFLFPGSPDDFAQLNHLDPLRALRPVMHPADNHVAPLRIMLMLLEAAAEDLEFGFDPLPFARRNFPERLAVGKPMNVYVRWGRATDRHRTWTLILTGYVSMSLAKGQPCRAA
jgi:hypothetical protein